MEEIADHFVATVRRMYRRFERSRSAYNSLSDQSLLILAGGLTFRSACDHQNAKDRSFVDRYVSCSRSSRHLNARKAVDVSGFIYMVLGRKLARLRLTCV